MKYYICVVIGGNKFFVNDINNLSITPNRKESKCFTDCEDLVRWYTAYRGFKDIYFCDVHIQSVSVNE